MTQSDSTSQVGVLLLSSNLAVSRQQYSQCDIKQIGSVPWGYFWRRMWSNHMKKGKIEVGYGVQSLQTISALSWHRVFQFGGSAGRCKEFPWVKLHSPEYAGVQKLYGHFMQISHSQNTLRIHKIHVKGTEIICNTSQKSMQYYLHLVNLQAHVPTLYRSCGHSMPLIGMAVLNSNKLHVWVAPHQKQRKFTEALVVCWAGSERKLIISILTSTSLWVS